MHINSTLQPLWNQVWKFLPGCFSNGYHLTGGSMHIRSGAFGFGRYGLGCLPATSPFSEPQRHGSEVPSAWCGGTETTHRHSVTHTRETAELSKHIWTLKDNNINHTISWNILARAKPYNSANKRCNLCLLQKFIIIRQPERSTLNKRNELVSSCRHRNKVLLRSNWQYPRGNTLGTTLII